MKIKDMYKKHANNTMNKDFENFNINQKLDSFMNFPLSVRNNVFTKSYQTRDIQ